MIKPLTIDRDAIYDDGALYQAMGLTAYALAAGRRDGSLRFTRKGRRTLYKGAWILAWIEGETTPTHTLQTEATAS